MPIGGLSSTGPRVRSSFGATLPTPSAARCGRARARKSGARKQSALSSSTLSPLASAIALFIATA